MIQKRSTAEGLVDFDEFCELIPDGQKADLLGGVIYVASPDSIRSNTINKFLVCLIDYYIAARNIDGFIFMSRVACRLSKFYAPEPDVGYVRPERAALVEETRINGAPDIVVEIVAHDSRDRDYGLKRDAYEEAGVEEYWIIDPLQKRCEFLRLVDGAYEVVPLERNTIFRSSVIPGFWLKVDWLLTKPLPTAWSCAHEILEGDAK